MLRRLGYACLCLSLPGTSPRGTRAANASPERLRALIAANLAGLLENDERLFGADDVLDASAATGLPKLHFSSQAVGKRRGAHVSRAVRWLGALVWLAQAAAGARVAWRLLRTGGAAPVRLAPDGSVAPGRVAIVVPVLEEATRLAACLDGLLDQTAEVGEIVIADGGSRDATPALIRAAARRDPRVRLVEAGPAPVGWNGKVWGLHAGERELRCGPTWLLLLDADVRPKPGLARSLVAHAERHRLRLLSVATAQRLAGPADGLLHPALLATLVYRFGRPGSIRTGIAAALANGQCCLVRRDLLRELGGFGVLRGSLCEDVTLARLAARAGEGVGFFEADRLVEVGMYADWHDAWRNWPRSLTTRDALFGLAGWLGLLEVVLAQGLPLALVLLGRPGGRLRALNRLLLGMRLGVLVGTARAYPDRPLTYWLSPVLDLAAAFALWRSALRRRHAWRGRVYHHQKGQVVAA